MEIGILGPAGTFSETAAALWLKGKEVRKGKNVEINYYCSRPRKPRKGLINTDEKKEVILYIPLYIQQ